MIKTGLFFGSFNPVHVGHLALANYIIENTDLEEVWFIVSPQNPFKDATDLIEPEHRIKMLKNAIGNYPHFKINEMELKLPTPSYTYKTIGELKKSYPDHTYTIIMGSDNFEHLHRWKNVEYVIETCPIIVYPRPGYEIDYHQLTDTITSIDAPVFNIDSTSIRAGILTGKDYRFLMPLGTMEYITEHNLYK